VVGPELVTLMEQRLRTYDQYVPVSSYRRDRRPRSYGYESYSYAFEPDYVPVVIRNHCARVILDPLALLDMPVAVANVCDLNDVPYDRVSNLVVELNLGDVPPVQFVEVLRYAPAALVVEGGYYGQPDFVQFVRSERVGGIRGYGLVSAIDRQLPSFGITAQIDVGPPVYVGRNYYAPAVAQNYVSPADPIYVPPNVRTVAQTAAQTRIGRGFAGSSGTSTPQGPEVAAGPQVRRLLGEPNAGAVVVNPGQARRELAQGRMRREAPIVAAPPVAAGNPVAGATPPSWGARDIHGRGRGPGFAGQPVPAIQAGPPPDKGNGNGNGRGRHFNTPAPVAAPAPAPMMASPGRGHGRDRAVSAPTVAAPPATIAPVTGRGPGNGRGRNELVAPTIVAPPPAVVVPTRGNGRERHVEAPPVVVAPQAAPPPAPVINDHGRGRGGPPPAPPAAVVTRAPAPAATPAPVQGPPGQQKKKDKEKGKDQ
jgi:hypothetical protein